LVFVIDGKQTNVSLPILFHAVSCRIAGEVKTFLQYSDRSLKIDGLL